MRSLREDHGQRDVQARDAHVGRQGQQGARTDWPQPHGYAYDIPKARALMKEAGSRGRFETSLSFDLGGATVSEPACILIQESLALIGIKCHDQEDPRRQLARPARC
jgi:hypothetical protein